MCLTSLVAFYDGVMASVNQGNVIDVIYLDSCWAFNMVPQNISFSTLGRYEGWNFQWIRNRLGGFNNFAGDFKHSTAQNTVERRDAIQWVLNRLQKWAHVNLMKFHKAKCKL